MSMSTGESNFIRKSQFSETTSNKFSIISQHPRSGCICGSHEFIVINLNTTSSSTNSCIKCRKCGKEYAIHYD